MHILISRFAYSYFTTLHIFNHDYAYLYFQLSAYSYFIGLHILISQLCIFLIITLHIYIQMYAYLYSKVCIFLFHKSAYLYSNMCIFIFKYLHIYIQKSQISAYLYSKVCIFLFQKSAYSYFTTLHIFNHNSAYLYS